MLTTTVGVTQDRPVATLPLTQEPSIESPVSNTESIEASAPTEVAETETQTTTVPTAAERSALLYASISEGGPQKLGPQEGLSALGLETSPLYGGYESVSARLDQISQADQLTQTNRIELPARLAAQIADVARQLPDGPIEISLSPEELGKVKLTFQVSENGAMNVVVAAERAETLEFMRRNIDSLLAEFSDLGYEGSSFQFQQDGQNANDNNAEQFGSSGSGTVTGDADGNATAKTDSHVPLPVRLHLDGASGMDLRL
jgi:flagellar hook-length control protein FliK